MKTRIAEVQGAPGEVIMAITDNDARLAVRLTPDEAQMLAADLASCAIRARKQANDEPRPPPSRQER
jgi:hypothetical protein